jgi:hypothetical protein
MVEVDVFWSYALGAGAATAAGRQIKARAKADVKAAPVAGVTPSASPDRWSDPYLVRTVLFAALLFAPSGLYLLWNFPSWETMHVGDRSMPAWLVCLFGITNVSQAILGYLVAKRLIARGRGYLGWLQTLGAYFGMFFILIYGWDGKGFQRFFSPTRADFVRWRGDWSAWLTSPVAVSLYVMGVIMLPVLIAGMVRWSTESERMLAAGVARAPRWRAATVTFLFPFFGAGIGLATLSTILLNTLGVIPGGVLVAAMIVALFAPGSVVHRLYSSLGYGSLDDSGPVAITLEPARA